MAYAGGRQRVVILGGGFAGAYAAKRLAKVLPKNWELTLIDRNNFLVFYPLLVEAGVGNIEPRHVVVPIRDFIGDQQSGGLLASLVELIAYPLTLFSGPRVRGAHDFRLAEVLGANLHSQQIHYRMVGNDEPSSMHYDHLLIALGSVTKMPPIPGLAENGLELKSLADSIALRDRAVQLLELANTVDDDEERRALLRVVVVGANFTGVELAGEYQDFLSAACGSYRNIGEGDISVVVLEMGDRILPALDEKLAQYAYKHLTRRRLDIRTKTSVTEVCSDHVILTTGEKLPTYTCVWAAGIAPSPVLDHVEGLPRDEKGWISCGADLRLKGFDNVWAAGDLAHVQRTDGKSYGATAQIASREGACAANNIWKSIRQEHPVPFEYTDAGSIAALGCRTAVAKVFGINVSGFVAWWFYRTVYVAKMPSWSRRIRIVMDWTIDLFFKRDIIQLGMARTELRRPRGPAASGDGKVAVAAKDKVKVG
jgi:NADH dehydrogenase